MLTTWIPAHMPEKEEIKARLQTARNQLYDFQMKIKEHKIPIPVPLFQADSGSRQIHISGCRLDAADLQRMPGGQV